MFLTLQPVNGIIMSMKKACCITTMIVGGTLFFGPPAAELSHDKDKSSHEAVMPRGTHEHPHNEYETTHVGEPYSMAYTASSATAISFTHDIKWAVSS